MTIANLNIFRGCFNNKKIIKLRNINFLAIKTYFKLFNIQNIINIISKCAFHICIFNYLLNNLLSI